MTTESKSQPQAVTDTETAVAPLVSAAEQNPLMRRISRELHMVRAGVDGLMIDTPELYTTCAERMQEVNGKIKDLNDHRLSLTRPLDESKKRIIATFQPTIELGETIVQSIKNLLLDYDDRQRLAREAAERKAREEAAALERQRAEAAAAERRRVEEAARIEREKVEAAQREADAKARAAKSAEDKAAAERAQEQARIDQQAAQQRARDEQDRLAREEDDARFMPVHVAPVDVPEPPKVKGISRKKTYKAEVRNLAQLVTHVAERIAAGDFSVLPLLKANDSEIAKRAKALGEHMNVPGIDIFEDRSIAAGRRG